jgi:potassium-transporting ATPase KdpC subunit
MRNCVTAILLTIVTTVLFGLVYPLAVTGLAQMLMPDKANGQLIVKDGKVVGSRIL